MKRNELQRFGNGLATLVLLVETDSRLSECSVIASGELLRSLLWSLSSTSSTYLTKTFNVRNEKLGKYLLSTVELTLKSSQQRSVMSSLYLLATLTNHPSYLNQTTWDTSPSSQPEPWADKTVLDSLATDSFRRLEFDFYEQMGRYDG